MKINFKFFLFLFLISLFSTFVKSNENKIIAKVGNEIISSYDLENEIRTNLFLQKMEFNQENVNNLKSVSIKNLITKKIKLKEIEKYNIENYDVEQFNNYIQNLANDFSTNGGLKNVFENNKIDYETFLDSIKIQLKWNTLILNLYKNQTNINPQEIENELKDYLEKNNQVKSYELSEIQINKSEYTTEKLKIIYDFIKKEGFSNAVSKFSVASSKNNNGKLGTFEETKLNESILKLVTQTKEGFYTEPYETDNFFTIFFIDKINIKQTELDLNSYKQKLINMKREEKLRLFSASHFSNLENSVKISFL